MDNRFLFAADLHGHSDRYRALMAEIRREPPRALLLGGDLFGRHVHPEWLLQDFLYLELESLHAELGSRYPFIFVIPGNDDERRLEPLLRQGESAGLWFCSHMRRFVLDGHPIYGYACTPPTPFQLKDWERYDVSRYVDPGCVPPEEGTTTAPPDPPGTIADDLARLAGDDPLADAICLFHAPPYRTALDRAALDGRMVDYAPLDVNVGSIAIRRFIEERQPLITLHGHVHEAPRLSGTWRDRIGRSHLFSAAHDGPELALVSFSPARPEDAERRLL